MKKTSWAAGPAPPPAAHAPLILSGCYGSESGHKLGSACAVGLARTAETFSLSLCCVLSLAFFRLELIIVLLLCLVFSVSAVPTSLPPALLSTHSYALGARPLHPVSGHVVPTLSSRLLPSGPAAFPPCSSARPELSCHRENAPPLLPGQDAFLTGFLPYFG